LVFTLDDLGVKASMGDDFAAEHAKANAENAAELAGLKLPVEREPPSVFRA